MAGRRFLKEERDGRSMPIKERRELKVQRLVDKSEVLRGERDEESNQGSTEDS